MCRVALVSGAGMREVHSYYELEAQEYLRRGVQLTPDLWLVKLLVGAPPASHPFLFPRYSSSTLFTTLFKCPEQRQFSATI